MLLLIVILNSVNRILFGRRVDIDKNNNNKLTLHEIDEIVSSDPEVDVAVDVAAYESLDYLEGKVAEHAAKDTFKDVQLSASHPVLADNFVGQLGVGSLLPDGRDVCSFGYASSSKFKIIVTLECGEIDFVEMKLFLKGIHKLYADAILNPFFADSLDTPKFLQSFETLVAYYSSIIYPSSK